MVPDDGISGNELSNLDLEAKPEIGTITSVDRVIYAWISFDEGKTEGWYPVKNFDSPVFSKVFPWARDRIGSVRDFELKYLHYDLETNDIFYKQVVRPDLPKKKIAPECCAECPI